MVTVIKRDGTLVDFDISKIINAISKASKSVHEIPSSAIEIMAKSVENKVKNNDKISVELIQDEVEKILIENNYSDIAKSYILYRDQRTRARDASSYITKTIHDLTNVNKDTNNKRENANINADSTMGTMLKYGSETAKWYNLRNVIRPKHAELHTKGIIHIHDLDFYSLCTNCTQIPLDKLFENGGFFTGHGYLRTPNSIGTAASLAAIAVQSSQNDFFGGQSIPMFDFYMAPYVKKSYIKNIASIVEIEENEEYANEVKEKLTGINKDNDSLLNKDRSVIVTIHSVCKDKDLSTIEKWIKLAKKRTDKDTYQAMEGLVHNLNTLACRSGSQVPFSSINFGMDTSEEGRMVSKNLMLAQEAGLGNGETAIFPITIFSIMPGYNYNPEDPNYDLFKLSCRVSAKRLFPNWNNIGATWNKKYFKEGHPETIPSVMGCADGEEIVIWKYKNKINVTNFKTMYDDISRDYVNEKYSNISEYLNTEANKEVQIWDSYSNKFVNVKKVIRNLVVNNWRRVTFSNGRVLDLTGDHPLPVIDKGRTYVDDLKIGDKIPIISDYSPLFNSVAKDNDFYYNNHKLAWILGVIICDGSLSGNCIIVSLGKDEEDICDKVEEYAPLLNDLINFVPNNEKYLPLRNVVTKRFLRERGEKGTYYDIYIYSEPIIKDTIIQQFRGVIKNKRNIPNWVFLSSPITRLSFLIGMIDADGYVNSNRINSRIQLGTINKSLALEQAVLAESIGKQVKVYLNHYNSKDPDKIRYRVEFFTPDNFTEYSQCQKKKNNVNEFKGVVANTEYCEVVSIESLSFDPFKLSYDVETESDRFDLSMVYSRNCRTRVIGNVWRPDLEVTPGRGNLSFTSINLPYIALEVNGDINKFFIRLDEIIDDVIVQLMDRYKIQSKRKAKNFPFTIQQGATIDGDKLEPEDELGDILRNGTLSIAYVGLAECLIVLTGKHHGESEEAQELGICIIKHMRKRMDDEAQKTKYNFSLIAAPAEGTCGTFADAIKKQFGIIKGISDKDFLTNGNHVPVYYNCTISHKVDVEAPYHELCNAGNIFYAEYDGDPLDNLEAFESIVRYAVDSDMGYISINHAVDRCSVCSYVGVIKDKCPRCGRTEDEWPTKEKLLELKKIYPNIRIPDWMK